MTTTTTTVIEEKYRVLAPESMQETFMSDSEDEGGRHTGLRVVVEKRHAPPHTSSPFPNYYSFSYFLIPLEYFSACRIKTLEDTREEQNVLQIDSTPFYTVCIPFSYSGLQLSLPDPPSL